MAAMFSPPADAGPSPPSTKAVRASTAAQHLAAGEHARAVWVQLSAGGPLTEETFVQPTKPTKPAKRRASAPSAPNPKRQAARVLAAAPVLGKGKRNALLKALIKALKGAASSKKTKWHEGDSDKLAASAVVDVNDFLALFPGVEMSKKGVTTSFSMTSEQITRAFGDVNLKVPTWSKSYRAFQKAYKTGSKPVSLVSAEGKYSNNTSTLTIKFNVRVAGGSNGFGWGPSPFGDDY